MRMRNIAMSAMVLVLLTTLGCSKKTEEPAKETDMAPSSSVEEMAPAPMQSMDQGMESESSPSSETDTHAMGTPENDQSDSQDGDESSGKESSGME